MSKVPGFSTAVKIDMVEAGRSLLEKMLALDEAGLDGVELYWPGPYDVSEVVAAQDASGIAVPGVVDSVHWARPLSHPDPAVRADGLAKLCGAVDYAAQIGASSVLVVPGIVGDAATFDECWERSAAGLTIACATAEAVGVDILVENVWNDFLVDPRVMAEYVDSVDSPRLGVHFDAGNAMRYSSPAGWITTLGSRVRKLAATSGSSGSNCWTVTSRGPT